MNPVKAKPPTWLSLAAACVFLILPGCEKGSKPKPPHAKPSKTIRIIDPVEANNLHVPLAARMGYFDKQGLTVQVSGTGAGKFAMDALVGGAVEYAVVVEMNVAHRLFEKDDVVILAEIAEPVGAIKVLGRRDQGVQSPQDVIGKRIGVLYGVNIHLAIMRFLEDHGIREDQVELMNLRPPDAVAAFAAGSIDVIITWQPHVRKLQQKLGVKAVVLEDNASKYWTYKMVLVTKRAYLEQNPEEARKVLKAIVEADHFIERHPDQAKELLAGHIHTPREEVDLFFDEIQFDVQITAELVEMLKTEVEWLGSTLLKGKKPVTRDYRSLIANLLAEVEPEAWKLDK